jgi:hypothetical protein
MKRQELARCVRQSKRLRVELSKRIQIIEKGDIPLSMYLGELRDPVLEKRNLKTGKARYED